MQSRKTHILQAIAIGGGLASLVTAIYALAGGATSAEGAVAIVLLLVLSLSLGAALGIQALTYGRAARYAGALTQILRLTDKIGGYDPQLLTGTQAAAICDRMVDELAKIFSQICGAPCFVSVEILTPNREGLAQPLRRSSDYAVVNLSRDTGSESLGPQQKRRHPVDGNSAFVEIFQKEECGAHYFSDDVAAERRFATTEVKAGELDGSGGGRLSRKAWPLHYRSTLVTKICQAEQCRAGIEHVPIGYLWLRSPSPAAFTEDFDVDLMRHMSKAIAPVLTRCVRATKPMHDFRRQSTVAQELARPTSA